MYEGYDLDINGELMIFKAFAKINLAIDVLEKRDDGYHNIDLICVPLELHDFIEIEEYGERCGTYVTSDDTSLICDESNLVYVAYRAVKHKYNLHAGFRIKIYKRIPTAAGLAGGSADAASIINGLIKMKKLNVSDKDKINIGLEIGSDVPYCLFNKPSRIQGKGEIITPIKIKNPYFVLLIKPQQGLSTKDVYEQADICLRDKPDIEGVIKALEKDDEKLLEKSMKNGLQHAAIELLPEIEEIINELKENDMNLSMMSGSGSTVFTLSHNLKKLKSLKAMFEDEGYQAYLTKMMI